MLDRLGERNPIRNISCREDPPPSSAGRLASTASQGSRDARRVILLLLCLAWWFAAGSGCAPKPSETGDTVGRTRLFAFVPDPDRCLGGGEPLALAPETSVRDALEHLAGRLAADYFNTPVSSGIAFEVVDIVPIPGPVRPLRVGVVNMIDPKGEAVRSFFQGSAGGRTTFCMVAATFLQPVSDPPLLDGLVVRYNGAPFQDLDHIRMGGIVTPSQIRKVAYMAVSQGM